MSPRLSGVIAAVPTPVHRDRTIDVERFLAHSRWVLENGCDAINILGSTGEATSFAPERRAELMREAARALPGAHMMVGTGTSDLETTIRLTSLAGACGFAAALVLPPYYYSGVSDDGLYAYFDAVVRETQGNPVPIYLYNFPQMTGVPFSQSLAARLKAAHPERIAGAKDSSGDLDYAESLARIADFDVFPSNETSLAVAPEKGYAGTISATLNITSRLAAELRSDPADASVLGRLRQIRETIAARPLVPAVKYLVGCRLQDPAWATVMPPFVPLTQSECDALAPLVQELAV